MKNNNKDQESKRTPYTWPHCTLEDKHASACSSKQYNKKQVNKRTLYWNPPCAVGTVADQPIAAAFNTQQNKTSKSVNRLWMPTAAQLRGNKFLRNPSAIFRTGGLGGFCRNGWTNTRPTNASAEICDVRHPAPATTTSKAKQENNTTWHQSCTKPTVLWRATGSERTRYLSLTWMSREHLRHRPTTGRANLFWNCILQQDQRKHTDMARRALGWKTNKFQQKRSKVYCALGERGEERKCIPWTKFRALPLSVKIMSEASSVFCRLCEKKVRIRYWPVHIRRGHVTAACAKLLSSLM